MWGYPYLSWFTIGAMVVVIAAMAILPATRADFAASLLTVVVVLTSYAALRRRRRAQEQRDNGVNRSSA